MAEKSASNKRSASNALNEMLAGSEPPHSLEQEPPSYHGSGIQSAEKRGLAVGDQDQGDEPPPPGYEEAAASSFSIGSSAQHARTSASAGLSFNIRIAIPQISSVKGAPFMRAYAPELSDLGVTEDEFITAIDTINQHAMGNSAFSALDLTGNFVHQVPLPIVSGLGYYLSTASKYGNAVSSRSGLQSYIDHLNESVFGPKGLRISTCDGKMLKMTFGLSARGPILPPLDSGIPLGRQLSVLQRRLDGLKGHAAAIQATSLPMPNAGTMNKLTLKRADKDMEAEEKELVRSRKKTLKYRQTGRLDDQDEEEKTVEKLLWLVVEHI